MNYVLIYKDTKENINYYYNFNDKLVYASDNKNNNCNIVGVICIIIGFIFYLTFTSFSYYLPYSYLFIILVGIIFGIVITLIANSTIKDIFKEKGRKMSINELKEFYKKNKSFRIKYFILLIAFFILTILNLVLYQNITTINCLLFTSVIMTTFLFLLYRPVNSFKFYKMINK
ncbi:MAG TPA: hypothetical protein IAB59_04315 [Candidatus Onthousia faecipullorum]|uniref:Uncharacterized protein n=1 Tax=Candidatus Onthousia faecipullorum TaxID=2840887 RepID=A0A9D1GBC9_9FIRM|nr:hypothetical protein [Candidatus Onthousia faecipullorum]